MVKNLKYEQIDLILATWDELHKIKDYHKVLGISICRKFLAKCPQGKRIFGWPMNIDPNSDEFLQSPMIVSQCELYMKMWDAAINMLGPELELLTDLLKELGEKHWRSYGVHFEMYQPMGDALIETLKEHLTELFESTPQLEQGWRDVYQELCRDMMYREVVDFYGQ